jgi:hypothetical protein
MVAFSPENVFATKAADSCHIFRHALPRGAADQALLVPTIRKFSF